MRCAAWFLLKKTYFCKERRAHLKRLRNKEMNLKYLLMQQCASWDGLKAGLVWGAAFLCSIYGMSNMLLSLAGNVLVVFSPFLVYRWARRRRELVEGGLTYGQAFYYFICVYFYASVIMAAVQFVYFSWMDGGYLYRLYAEMLRQPAYQQLFRQMGEGVSMDAMLASFKAATMRPAGLVFGFMGMHILIGFVLSLLSALFLRRKSSSGRLTDTQNIN